MLENDYDNNTVTTEYSILLRCTFSVEGQTLPAQAYVLCMVLYGRYLGIR